MLDEKILKRRPSGPGRLSAEQAADLPDRILDAALELFSQDGYGGTTMERIAKKAGASTKTIYARYDNKADILQAVVVRLQDRTIAAHAATLPPDLRSIDPHQFLASFGVNVVMNLNEQATAGLNRLAALAVQLQQLRHLVFTLRHAAAAKPRRTATAALHHIRGAGNKLQQVQRNIFGAASRNHRVHNALIPKHKLPSESPLAVDRN